MAAARRRGTRIRVGIIDDHRSFIDGLVAWLEAESPELEIIGTAQSWPEFLLSPGFPPQVAIMDFNLNDDIPLGVKINALSAAGARTIVVSGYGTPRTEELARTAGAWAFADKSQSVSDLARLIGAVAAGIAWPGRPPASAPKGTVPLGARELLCAQLAASGSTLREAAAAMGLEEDSVRTYLKRVRRKYRDAGFDVGTKILLRRQLLRDGYLPPET